jgi:hypothetical protein
MKSRFAAIAQRRLALVEEIGLERERMAAALEGLRKQVAMAGLGLLASRLLGRSRWLRLAAVAAMAVSAAGPLLVRFLSTRR